MEETLVCEHSSENSIHDNPHLKKIRCRSRIHQLQQLGSCSYVRGAWLIIDGVWIKIWFHFYAVYSSKLKINTAIASWTYWMQAKRTTRKRTCKIHSSAPWLGSADRDDTPLLTNQVSLWVSLIPSCPDRTRFEEKGGAPESCTGFCWQTNYRCHHCPSRLRRGLLRWIAYPERKRLRRIWVKL